MALLRSGPLACLDLALYETNNVAVARWRDPGAAERLAARIWAISELGTLVRVDPPLTRRAAEVAASRKLSAYDAADVAAAERLGATLASCDERDLVSAGLAKRPEQLVGH